MSPHVGSRVSSPTGLVSGQDLDSGCVCRQEHPRQSFRTYDFRDFMVEHLSGYEHNIHECECTRERCSRGTMYIVTNHALVIPTTDGPSILSHPNTQRLIGKRTQHAEDLCKWKGERPALEALESTTVLTYFWGEDRGEATDAFHRLREGRFRATLCSASR
jgi:hypothetical protein